MSTTGLCECGCLRRTTISNRTRANKGHVKGQPMRFVIGHVNQGKTETLETRFKKSRALTGKKPTISPYIPDLLVTFDSVKKRWRASRGRKSVLHARAVWEHFKGEVPKGYRVHHKNGKCDKLQDDSFGNLMLLTNEWNLDYMPSFSKYLGVDAQQVTDAYLVVEKLPYEERFSAVRRILLQQIKGEK